MKKILNIISSITGENSVSNKLSNSIIDRLLATYPGSEVITVDLSGQPIRHMDAAHVAAFYGSQGDDENDVLAQSDKAIQQVLDADILVIGVPYYNFGIPSTLKAWLDQIIRVGVTFKYQDGAVAGFVTGKQVYLAIASGGVYSEGPMKMNDVEPHLRTALGFIGMTHITVFRAEGSLVPELKETVWPGAMQQVDAYAF